MDITRNGFKTRDILLQELKSCYDSEEEFFIDFTTLKNEKVDEYREILDRLKELKDKKANSKTEQAELTAQKGKTLEGLVKFLLINTGMFDVYGNIPTSTNEIDQVISLSFKGERLLEDMKMSYKTIGLEDTYFIGECKNYHKKVASTWVGKFYTLMKVSGGCKLGVLFSYHGLSGAEDKWCDAHGLTKILYQLGSAQGNTYIIDFNINDFEKIAQGISFFKILKDKKLAIQIGAKVENFNIKHENENKIGDIVRSLIN